MPGVRVDEALVEHASKANNIFFSYIEKINKITIMSPYGISFSRRFRATAIVSPGITLFPVISTPRSAFIFLSLLVHMPETVYVFELKLNGLAKDALDQIDRKGYAVQYQTNKRKLVKAGLSFSSKTKTLTDWTIV